MNHICKYCDKPVILVPSAYARAKKFGKTAQYYKDLFPNHSDCVVTNREQQTKEANKGINK
jgi:hypothetical protein